MLLTRAEDDQAAWAEGLRRAGALPLEYACIATRALPLDADALARAVAGATWLVFGSRRAIEAVTAYAPALLPEAPRLACVGPATADACAAQLARPDLVPGGGTLRDLARALAALLGPDEPVALLGAREGRDDLELELGAARVRRVPVYETVLVEGGEAPPLHDAVVFASPSAVAGFAARAGAPAPGTLCVALGPSTLSALEARGWAPRAAAATRDLDGVLAALEHGLAAHAPRTTS
ncbi:MAG: uroporphyrinogen-III synthase [Planctomycetes bacterium]|nr:uroporphyrinogen-III synthase [Planctomycetota bacterium]